jgi:hypothetical protein
MTEIILAECTKTVGVIYRCCRKHTKRVDYTVHSKTVNNNHPVDYLRRVTSYRCLEGGRFIPSSRFSFPVIICECGQLMGGTAIEGKYTECPCDRRCTGAKGHNCECSCGGTNHGIDHR